MTISTNRWSNMVLDYKGDTTSILSQRKKNCQGDEYPEYIILQFFFNLYGYNIYVEVSV